ncbi:uncharacterized protein DUF4260 [Thermosporothrix hazakensis]|jgi:hypothetical protein|uniref:Uncharacterized protein DUF4260 n=2 Tax=Thermosporothrix TaxID=768650 RepID=A0A326U8Q7_THEHA|nr:DUF4260 domain-containing protein [Thermosporothrix hazakensis]PZW32556.1 uncharacterized protein DUF4260 [Thermosporothrix hazakensis]GCE49909.1 hypothetical protein KTH_47780 [Thermosporothrix hazakensis]
MKRFNLFAPAVVLRLEGITVFLLALLFYGMRGGNWLLFLLLLFVPDLSMLGYLAGARVGAIIYNLIHAYVLPLALLAFGLIGNNTLLALLALIWLAHIGLDRVLGYGLKYPTFFKDTHLNRV